MSWKFLMVCSILLKGQNLFKTWMQGSQPPSIWFRPLEKFAGFVPHRFASGTIVTSSYIIWDTFSKVKFPTLLGKYRTCKVVFTRGFFPPFLYRIGQTVASGMIISGIVCVVGLESPPHNSWNFSSLSFIDRASEAERANAISKLGSAAGWVVLK